MDPPGGCHPGGSIGCTAGGYRYAGIVLCPVTGLHALARAWVLRHAWILSHDWILSHTWVLLRHAWLWGHAWVLLHRKMWGHARGHGRPHGCLRAKGLCLVYVRRSQGRRQWLIGGQVNRILMHTIDIVLHKSSETLKYTKAVTRISLRERHTYLIHKVHRYFLTNLANGIQLLITVPARRCCCCRLVEIKILSLLLTGLATRE